jgi:predicted transcriptional regulator YheO
MRNLTNFIITDFIDQLIDEMDYEDSVNYVTLKFAEIVSTVLENPSIKKKEKEKIMLEILQVLKEHGIYDLAYILE